MELTVTSDDMANVADAQGAVDGSEEDVVPEQGDSTEDNVTSEQSNSREERETESPVSIPRNLFQYE